MGNKQDFNLAVMVSGGIDSYIAYEFGRHSHYNVVPVFINLGQPYVDKELQACRKLFPDDLIVVQADLCTTSLRNIPTIEQQEIFGRNLLIAFYGAILAKRVWIAALSTEMNPTAVRDKHPEFFHMCSALFTYTFKSKRFDTIVETPFATYTKSDIIGLALDKNYVTEEKLKQTTSCYGEVHNCGECSTCFKRWIAMTNNNIREDYVVNPWTNKYAQSIMPEIVQLYENREETERFSHARLVETINAFNAAGIDYKTYK